MILVAQFPDLSSISRIHHIMWFNGATVELTFRAADVKRICDVAGETNMQRAAEAFVMRLSG